MVKHNRINRQARQKHYFELIDVFKYKKSELNQISQETSEIIKAEIVRPLINYSKKKGVDFNQSGSEHSQNAISLAIQFNAGEEVLPLLHKKKFDPNRQDYLQMIINKRIYSTGKESQTWGKVLEALIDAGAIPTETNLSLFSFSTRFYQLTTHQARRQHQHFAKNGHQEKHLCCSCFDVIQPDEPYFWGLSNCECLIHYECSFNIVINILDTLFNENPLERTIPKCPICHVTLSPTFIDQLQRTIDDSSLLKYRPENYQKDDMQSKVNRFKQLTLPEINRHILRIRYASHPNRVECPSRSCDGFYLVEPDSQRRVRCRFCFKERIFRGRTTEEINLSKQDQKNLLKVIKESQTKNNNPYDDRTSIRPCPHCHQLIQHNGGCHSMKCRSCGKRFNWLNDLISNRRLKSAHLK